MLEIFLVGSATVFASFAFVLWLDLRLNQNDDATTIGQFKKFQDSFKGGK